MRFPLFTFLLLLLVAVLRQGSAAALPLDTSKNVVVNIISARNSYGIQTDSGLLQRLIDSVQFQQGETFMSCDSAYLNLVTNNMEAFGNVRIIQPGGTQVVSDYLRYTGNKKLAYLNGNVSLTDGKNNLWSEDLTYDVASKTGTYDNGGTLQSDATTLSSNAGSYNTRTKDARFKGEVFVSDPEYNVTSEDLGYNTGSKMVRFFGPSVVTNDKSELRTKSGTYDSQQEIAHFTTRSSIQNGPQYIEGDTLDYNGKTGWGKARGKVIAIDTTNKSQMWGGYAAYNEISRELFANTKPVLRNVNGTDTLYIRADTFYSALQSPFRLSKADTLARKSGKAPVRRVGVPTQYAVVPRVPVDTTAPRFYIGYHHVRIWSDSLQGVCDSIAYSAKDSVMKMMGAPVAWSKESQITGDTILLYTDSSELKRLYVPNNALIVSRTGPEKAAIFDQVQGKTLNGYFKDGKLDYMVVFPAAESIYYPKDDGGAYLGVNQSESERMKVFFLDAKIHRIIFEQEVKQKMSPLDKVLLPAMRLSRFQWLSEKRPKSREELFR